MKNIFKLIYDFQHTLYINLLCYRLCLDCFTLLKNKADIILLDTSDSLLCFNDVLSFFSTLSFISAQRQGFTFCK